MASRLGAMAERRYPLRFHLTWWALTRGSARAEETTMTVMMLALLACSGGPAETPKGDDAHAEKGHDDKAHGDKAEKKE